MVTSQGFSLTEVLVSLLLLTGTALTLLTHQWLCTGRFNQNLMRANGLTELINAEETTYARMSLEPAVFPYTITKKHANNVISWHIDWPLTTNSSTDLNYLNQQQVVIE